MPVPTKKTSSSGQKMPTKLRLKVANTNFQEMSTKMKLKSPKKEFKFHILNSSQVNDIWLTKMMELFEPLMRDLYEKSSWGWNREEKMDEFKHSKTKMVLVTKKDVCDISDNICMNKLPEDEDDLVGFMNFRFESGADKSESSLYVYELHVHQDFQRQGLGEELMRIARVFGTEFKMDKIMLTVFRSNAQALQFYNKLKYNEDASSPAKNEADYVILSSKLK